MERSKFVQAMVRQRQRMLADVPNPSLLTLEIRRGLHEVGYTEVHQSDLGTYGTCPRKMKLGVTQQGVKAANMLLGTVLHLALEEEVSNEGVSLHGMSPKFWKHLFIRARDKDPTAVYTFHGAPITVGTIDEWCRQFCQSTYWQTPLANLVLGLMGDIVAEGYVIIGVEENMSFTDGDDTNGGYPILFEGTLDLLLYHPGRQDYVIVDMKSYNLWGPLSIAGEDKETTAKKVVYSPLQIQFSRQMRHYHWMKRRLSPHLPITHYGFGAPTNKVAYLKATKDAKAGDPKGPGLMIGPALEKSFIDDYERNMVSVLKSMSQDNFPKMYPESFGKSDCPTCWHFKLCSGAPNNDLLATIGGYE